MADRHHVPPLATARLSLRAFEPGDAHAIQTLAGDHAIADTTQNIPYPYPDGAAEAWIAKQSRLDTTEKALNWAISPRGSDELLGSVGLRFDTRDNKAVLGYWIAKHAWGNGYATEVARAAVDFGFRERELNRITADYLARNPASGRVLEKIGMTHEGVARQDSRKWGQYEDVIRCAILRSEWEANQI